MAEYVAGEWFLAIDLGQRLSGVMVDDHGVILIPFHSQQSVHAAAGKLRLGIVPPVTMVQGEVIERTEDPGRIQAIANQADYDVP